MLAPKTGLTSLTEQVLQILPSYGVGKLQVSVNTMRTTSLQRKVWRDATNVGDIDLTATATCTHAATISPAETAACRWPSLITATASCWWTRESRFGLTVLIQQIRISATALHHIDGTVAYLSNVNKSTHEVLIAESVDGLLSLLPRGIFYNAVDYQQAINVLLGSVRHLPASLHNPRNNVPIRQSNIPSMTKKKKRFKKPATYRRPPSTFHSEAIAHQQRGPLQLEKTDPQLAHIPSDSSPALEKLTRSHKVFEVMPLNIVR